MPTPAEALRDLILSSEAGVVDDAVLAIPLQANRQPASVTLARPAGAPCLTWGWRDSPEPIGREARPAAPECFWRFLDLADAPDDAILAFAREWGVLELCEQHGLPASHNPG